MKNVINVGRKHFILKSFISSFGRKQLSCQALFPLRRPKTFILQGFYFSPSTGNSYIARFIFRHRRPETVILQGFHFRSPSAGNSNSAGKTGNIYLDKFSFPLRRPETNSAKERRPSPSISSNSRT